MTKKSNSRAARWEQACSNARDALERVQEAASELDGALEELRDLKGEYEDWLGNLPDSLRSSPVGEKLETVVAIDFEQEIDIDGISSALDEAESVDLPQGFGRD